MAAAEAEKDYAIGAGAGTPVYCMRPRLFEQLKEWFAVVHPESVQLDGSLRIDCLLLEAGHYVDEPEDVRHVTL